jgi:hypothetical protein
VQHQQLLFYWLLTAAGVASKLQMNLPNGRTMHVAKAAVQPSQQAKLHRTGVHVIEQVNFCGLVIVVLMNCHWMWSSFTTSELSQ